MSARDCLRRSSGRLLAWSDCTIQKSLFNFEDTATVAKDLGEFSPDFAGVPGILGKLI